jgi:hypothetical protein
MPLHRILIPNKIQEVFFGKCMPSIPTEKDLNSFKSYLSEKSDSKIEVVWIDNNFQLGGRDLFSCHLYVTRLRGRHQLVGNRFEIQSRYDYSLGAKIITSASLVFISMMAYINSELVFGTLVLYLFVHFEGMLISIIDMAFNSQRETIINDTLRRAAFTA